MISGKIVADGWTDGRTGGEIEGSTRGPRGPKKGHMKYMRSPRCEETRVKPPFQLCECIFQLLINRFDDIALLFVRELSESEMYLSKESHEIFDTDI